MSKMCLYPCFLDSVGYYDLFVPEGLFYLLQLTPRTRPKSCVHIHKYLIFV